MTQSIIEFGASDISLESTISSLNNGNSNSDEIITLSTSPTKHLRNKVKLIKNFLDGNEFEEVVIIGHSLLGDDLYYFNEIFLPKFRNLPWTLYYHNADEEIIKRKFAMNNHLLSYVLKPYPIINMKGKSE